MHYFLRLGIFLSIFFIPLALAAFEGRPTLLPYVPFPIGITYPYFLSLLINAFTLEIKAFVYLQIMHFILFDG